MNLPRVSDEAYAVDKAVRILWICCDSGNAEKCLKLEIHGKAELIIGKQRHGPTGTAQLQFKADVTRFSDLADESRLPQHR